MRGLLHQQYIIHSRSVVLESDKKEHGIKEILSGSELAAYQVETSPYPVALEIQS